MICFQEQIVTYYDPAPLVHCRHTSWYHGLLDHSNFYGYDQSVKIHRHHYDDKCPRSSHSHHMDASVLGSIPATSPQDRRMSPIFHGAKSCRDGHEAQQSSFTHPLFYGRDCRAASSRTEGPTRPHRQPLIRGQRAWDYHPQPKLRM